MTRSLAPAHDPGACAAFEERLPAWLDATLDDETRLVMEQHLAQCPRCTAIVSDLDDIVQAASSLPVLVPSRDLWSGIEARLGAPVVSLNSRRDDRVASTVAPALRAGSVSMRWAAVAAAALIVVTAGVTWSVARVQFAGANAGLASAGVTSTGAAALKSSFDSGSDAAPVPGAAAESSAIVHGSPVRDGSIGVATAAAASGDAASGDAVAFDTGSAAAASGSSRARSAPGVLVRAASMDEVDAIYEREIAALRDIVRRRFSELDPATAAQLRQNLRTIDKAIEDSRRALQRDPRSGVLSTELDRTIEAKLALMRRVALL